MREPEDDRKRAAKARLCLRFFPLRSNKAFNGGRWLSPNYAMLVQVDGEPDWSEFTVWYADGRRFVVRGEGLKGLADMVESGTASEIRQIDPLQARSGGLEFAVLGLEVIEPTE